MNEPATPCPAAERREPHAEHLRPYGGTCPGYVTPHHPRPAKSRREALAVERFDCSRLVAWAAAEGLGR